MKRIRHIMIILVFLIFILLLNGCANQWGADSSGKQTLKLAFVCKDLDHYWFNQEKKGMKRKCETLGIEFEAYDADYDEETCLKEIKQAIKNGCNGIIICACNQFQGSDISKLCNEAGIPAVAIDDNLKDLDGKDFPYVAMALKEVCSIGGSELIRMSKERGFPENGTGVHVIMINVETTESFQTRNSAYQNAIKAGGTLKNADYIMLESRTGMYEDNLESVQKYFEENPPGTEDYFIICGANDDCALAPLHCLRRYGVEDSRIVACGLGGYELSIKEFREGNTNYITLMTQPDQEGEKAVEMLYAYLTEGTKLASEVMIGGVVATCDNYMIYFDESEN